MAFFRPFALLFLTALAGLAATFGTVVPLTGGASDIVLDEPRNLVYLVNTGKNQIELYSIAKKTFLTAIPTDAGPLSAAISFDGKYLYVACNTASSLNIINLSTASLIGRVSLLAKPEGTAVGNDGRVLISTAGSGTGNLQNVLIVYNPADASVNNVIITPATPQAPTLPAPSGRPALAARSQLRASGDGRYIVGANISANASQSVFVYETASATVLRSRKVANISNVLAVSNDGSKFMAGLTLFDAATLTVLAQENLANASYPLSTTANFNTQANQGGSIFTPAGDMIYAAFNIAPTANPPTRANVSQLMYNDPTNLLITNALQLPENLAGKMAITADGATVYALSESGMVILPMSQVNSNPIAAVDQTFILLAADQCGVVANLNSGSSNVTNIGKGKLTATVALQAASTTAGPGNLGGGGGISIIIGNPGGPGTPATAATTTTNAGTAPTVRTTNTASGASFTFSFNSSLKKTIGTTSPVHDFLVQSPEAVNLPPRIRILQNSRNAEAVGTLIPIPVGISATQALSDIVYDGAHKRLYIANAGLNQIEVFDIQHGQLMTPIKVGQLPNSIAMTPDGGTMYVANSGGESISIVDVASMKTVGSVVFPAIPFDASAALITPSIIAATQRGAIFLTSSGALWSVIGNQAVARQPSAIIGSTRGVQTPISTPFSMAATPEGNYVIVSAGTGFVYLYDALVDDFVQGRQIQTAPFRGYRGPITAASKGAYYVVNGITLNSALTPVSDVPSVSTTSGTTTTSTVIPIAAVTPLTATTYARYTQPVRLSANATPTTAPTIDIIDVTTGATRNSVSALEGPLAQVASSTSSANISGRTMVVDTLGTTAYALSTTGLSIVPLASVSTASRPVLNQRATVNVASLGSTVAPNTIVTIGGRNLAADATAPTTGNLPTTLGGVCVTMGTTPMPLIMTSATQINAQIPAELGTGSQQVTVHSIGNNVASASQSVTLSKYAPAPMLDSNGLVLLYRVSDGKQITTANPANRDEPLVLYAVGLGVPSGAKITSGVPVAASPLISTATVNVYFGNPLIKEAGIIVDSSTVTPGMIGMYQINLRVPGAHISGKALPVTIKIGGVSSPTTGAVTPTVAVN